MQFVEMKRSQPDKMGSSFFGKLMRSVLAALLLSGIFCVVLVIGTKLVKERFLLQEAGGVMQPVGKLPVQQSDSRTRVMPDVAIQAVFVTGEDGVLCNCFYTVLDCMENRIEFYMVPTDTRLQLSAGLYQELVTKNTKLAQVNTLEGLYRCFDKKDAAECAVKALGEAVGVTADYITIMPEICYDNLMKDNAHTYVYDDFLRENLRESVKASGGMKAYLTSIWEQCESSVTPESKLYYLETYEGLTNLSVSCRMIAGERHNNGYVLDGGFR